MSHLPKVTQLVSVRTANQTCVILTTVPCCLPQSSQQPESGSEEPQDLLLALAVPW